MNVFDCYKTLSELHKKVILISKQKWKMECILEWLKKYIDIES